MIILRKLLLPIIFNNDYNKLGIELHIIINKMSNGKFIEYSIRIWNGY